MPAFKKLVLIILIILIILIGFLIFTSSPRNDQNVPAIIPPNENFWSIRSVDTMKYSRDLARQELKNPQFDQVINQQMAEIASTGANYVAIDTPYDQEFLPILTRWVESARAHNLKVWFRGNFSGWEGWFDYPKTINRAQHLNMTSDFIEKNPGLFADGDIFTSCPECENGGAGDPRSTGDVQGFRQFLILEDQTAQTAFVKIGKQVATNYFSMNGDVAKLVMDKPTTAKLGGVVTIDHYVATPEKMISDINALAKNSGGKIILGEFGAPIPDINGTFTDSQQKNWMEETLDRLARDQNVTGLNYWVSVGGSTALWNGDNTARSAVAVINSYYKPDVLSGQVLNALSQPVSGAEVLSPYKKVITDSWGRFFLPKISDSATSLQVAAKSYQDLNINLPDSNVELVLQKTHESLWFRFLKLLKKNSKKVK